MTEALDAFLGMAKSHGFITRNIDNMAGYIDTSDDASLPLYGLMCHLDVVPAGDRRNGFILLWWSAGKRAGFTDGAVWMTKARRSWLFMP